MQLTTSSAVVVALSTLAGAAEPFIIAHRGASGERPEHTLAAYRLALEEGADYIEPDLRLTKDGIFIALHDGSLNRTTDVAAHPEFAGRAKLNKQGAPSWSPGDFTLAEIRTLRCRQGTAGRPKDFDGKEGIPTLEEAVLLVRTWNHDHKTRVGLIPELRGGAGAFVEFIHQHKLEAADAPPIYLQSFEPGTLKEVRSQLKFPAALLLSEAPAADKLSELKSAFDAVAVAKAACLKDDSAAWIKAAHRSGLQVIAWTFADPNFDPARFKSSQEEMEFCFRNGVDAVFTDFPAVGVKARRAFLASAPTAPPK
jgi:glycerophosphoryl diester phosphodiesterase